MPYKTREARNAYARDYYAKHPKRHRELVRANNARYRAALRHLIDVAKSKPCSDCGGTYDPEAMDFDHVRGEKQFNIGDAISRGVSIKRLEAELAKCELVCSNCHRGRTRLRR